MLYNHNKLLKILQAFLLISVFIFMCGPSYALAVTGNIDFEDVDADDIDIAIGAFNDLVKAFEKFFTADNSILEQRIDQIFEKFNDTIKCTVAISTETGRNIIERSLPNFDMLRSAESKACKDSSLIDYGTGGLIDRTKFFKCTIQEYIITKPVKMKHVSSAYSGLKETAKAPYCYFRDEPDSIDFDISKGLLADASILNSAYYEISNLDGCNNSDPKSLYECTLKYYEHQKNKLLGFRSIDTKHINFKKMEKEVTILAPPSVKRHKIFWKVTILTKEQLDDYEKLIASSRRDVETAQLSKRMRIEEYNKEIPYTVSQIKTIHNELSNSNKNIESKYLKCNYFNGICSALEWPAFSDLVSSLTTLENTCKKFIPSDRYSDIVSDHDRTICNNRIDESKKRKEEIETHFIRKNNDVKISSTGERHRINIRTPK